LLPKEIIKMNLSKENEYGITLVSLNEKFRERFEKYTSTYKERIASLKKLHDAGLKTRISMEPFPTPELDESLKDPKGFDKLLESISFVDKIIFGKLNYNVQVTQFKYS
jgi:DNA repair photolyase